MKNYWHAKQVKNPRGTFAPKWDQKTVEWIIGQLKESQDENKQLEITFSLCKVYSISIATANLWVEMAKRVMIDIQNGDSIEIALEKDKHRRNQQRRKTRVN